MSGGRKQWRASETRIARTVRRVRETLTRIVNQRTRRASNRRTGESRRPRLSAGPSSFAQPVGSHVQSPHSRVLSPNAISSISSRLSMNACSASRRRGLNLSPPRSPRARLIAPRTRQCLGASRATSATAGVSCAPGRLSHPLATIPSRDAQRKHREHQHDDVGAPHGKRRRDR